MNTLQEKIQTNNPYQGYSYSYPHKSAYRPFSPPIALKEAWSPENKESLFLYLHIPFCEMRCGFCNLFTMANPKEGMENPYLPALQRQAQVTKEAIGTNSKFARLAIGGGTPSFLSIPELEKMFHIIHETMGIQRQNIPASMEVSPKTVDAEKLALMKEQGINRVSIGIQSFFEGETKQLGRPQKSQEIKNALTLLKAANFPLLNIDLIYGGGQQTLSSWQESLKQCIDWQPEEIFLYPLYVRPLTGLDKRSDQQWSDFRLQLYRAGRDFLLKNDYEQITMRIFRKKDLPEQVAPPYNSPEDGMVGLGVGARSYTRQIHYSSEYAVGRKGVKNIIESYNQSTKEDFQDIYYGIELSPDEQKRRYVIKSLLEGENLDKRKYFNFFNSQFFEDLPEMYELFNLNLANDNNGVIQLNERGLELSDVIGPYLYSAQTNILMEKTTLV